MSTGTPDRGVTLNTEVKCEPISTFKFQFLKFKPLDRMEAGLCAWKAGLKFEALFLTKSQSFDFTDRLGVKAC